MASNNLSLDQLKRAVQIHERIESLQAELASILGGGSGTGAKRVRKPGSKNAAKGAVAVSGDEAAFIPSTSKKSAKKKRVMSPEAREKIAAAQRKRWAKQKR